MTCPTNKDTKKASGYRKKSGGVEKKSEDKTDNKCHSTCGEAGHRSKNRPYGGKIMKLIAEGKIVLVTGHRVANCSSTLRKTEANVHVLCNKD